MSNTKPPDKIFDLVWIPIKINETHKSRILRSVYCTFEIIKPVKMSWEEKTSIYKPYLISFRLNLAFNYIWDRDNAT